MLRAYMAQGIARNLRWTTRVALDFVGDAQGEESAVKADTEACK
jgi:hypothetical protein